MLIKEGAVTLAHFALYMNALQKQVGCFNHRVASMVADKLKRQWL